MRHNNGMHAKPYSSEGLCQEAPDSAMKYSDIVMDHFNYPRQAGEPDGWNVCAEADNPVCLDRLKVYLLIAADGTIEDAGWQAEGCVPTLAAASFLCQWAKGRGIKKLAALTANDVTTLLGGLPATKKHAAYLATEVMALCAEKFFSPP